MPANLIATLFSLSAWKSAIAMLTVVALSACGGGGGDGDGGTEPAPGQAAAVTVKVVDVLGFAKAGASVSVVNGTSTGGVTGADGQTRIDLPPDQDVLIEVALAGHTQQFRPLRVGAGQSAFLQATLLARAPALTLPDAAAGGTLVGKNASRLTLPPGALVDAQSGAPVTGAVQVEMTPVNTNSHEIAAFPGSMRAIAGTTEGQLLTYGPVEYIFTQGGRRLQLAPGQSAVIEMPLHATLDIDGTPLEVGESMPVWSLNETTGVWLQEGMGTVVASASNTGLALRATVSHFSWWNPDHFSDRATLRLNFVFEDNAVPSDCCHVEAFTLLDVDNNGPTGIATTTLPPTGGSVVVNANVVYFVRAKGLSNLGPIKGDVTVSVPAGSGTVTATITLRLDPDQPFVVITSPAAGQTLFTNGVARIEASVSGSEPDAVTLLANQQVVGPMNGTQTSGYSFDWDTTTRSEGTYTVIVRAILDGENINSFPRNVVVDRTPPTVVGRVPSPNFGQTDAGAVVVATFNEPIDPDSLSNPDNPAALRTELRLGGQSNGTLVPATVTLSVDGLSLSLAPQAPLATGNAYSVFIEGLTDRAGNTMAPETWSFTVPLFGFVGPNLTVLEDSITATVIGRPALALDSSGQPVVGWGSSVNNQPRIQVRRFVAPLWVSLPPLALSAPFLSMAMVLDQTGQPVVAWTQNSLNTPASNCGSDVFAIQLFAARFNGIGWSPLGTGALNLNPCSNPQRPRMALDLAGRPVLVATEGPQGLGRTVRVQRFSGNSWELLGTVPPRAPSAVSNVDLDLAMQGNLPVVLVSENRLGPIDHFVTRLNNGVAEPLGGLIATGNVAGREPALAVDSLGRPVLALQLSPSEMRVYRFEGGSWGNLGPALPTPGGGVTPSLVFSGTEPRVSYLETQIFPSPASTRLYDNTLAVWSDPLTILNSAGAISRAARTATGPTWLAATTGPFNRELRVIRSDTLP